MVKLKGVRVGLFLAIIISILSACGKTEVPQGATYEVLEPDAFSKKMEETADYQLVDARTPGEVAAGKLSGAVAYDYKADEIEKAANELDKSKPVFIYCGSGIRSEKSAEILMKAGFTEIYDMKGGMKAWKAAGKEVE